MPESQQAKNDATTGDRRKHAMQVGPLVDRAYRKITRMPRDGYQ